MAKISEIEGIGPAYAAKLEAGGIKTQEALLEKGRTTKARKQIAADCDISDKLVLKWINRADLARVKGVGSEYADLLECAGVDTVPELGQRSAVNLAKKMAELNEEKKLVRKVPTEAQVTDWVAQAKELPRAIEY